MEAYTSMKLNVKGNVDMNIVVEVMRKGLLSKATDEYEERTVNRFCDDIEIKGNQVVVEDSCTLGSWEFEYLREALIAVAKETDCDFTFKANHSSCNCGYEAYIEAEYKDGVLNCKIIGDDDIIGYCSDEDCGEFIVHALDYDPNQTYTCPECGRVVTEEELFPNGVPTWEVEEIRIK